MSHLACADEPDTPANELQRQSFEVLRRKLPTAPASFANSSGIFLGPAYHFDLGRPGVALYGVNPTPGQPNPMLPVVRLDVKVVQTREIGDGVGIGYGHSARARLSMRLATVSLGYADGWHRNAAGAAWFEGVRLPFAGRVSMDSIILDISALEPGKLQPGDLIEFIGPHQSVDDVAEYAGTIGYEILTGLGPRFYRVYAGA
jgi:alanine racemase